MKTSQLIEWLGRAHTLRATIVTGLLLSLLGLYLSLTRLLPFDLGWDMDIMTVNDALLLNSHLFPLHFDHPKFGMHLVTVWALKAGHWLGLVSVADFTEFRQCPSPMLCVAELTLYLRAVTAVAVWLILVLAVTLLWLLFPRARLLRLMAIPLLGLQTGLIYCSVTMRTEAYSILFLLLGLVSFSWVCRPWQRPVREIQAWLLGGLCFGLALLTKLQAILATPFFLVFCFYLYSRQLAKAQPLPETGTAGSDTTPAKLAELPDWLGTAVAVLFGLSVVLLTGLAWLAWHTPTLPSILQPNLVPWTEFRTGKLGLTQLLPHIKLQLVWLLLLGSGGASLVLARLRPQSPYQRFWQLYPLFWVGVVAAFAAPLPSYGLSPEGLAHGWRYLLQMAQSCLWTDTGVSTTASAGSFASTLWFALVTNKNYLLLALAALVTAGYLLVSPREQGRPGLRACLASFFTGTILLLIGSRAILRDTIWFEFLGSLSALLLLLHCWQELHGRALLQALLGFCLLLPAGVNVLSLGATQDQIYLYFAPFISGRYTALANAFLAETYMDWPQVMIAAYGQDLLQPATPNHPDKNTLRLAVAQARLLEPLRQMVDLPFVNLKVPVRALGLAEPLFPVWATPSGWARFESLEPYLRGSVLVNPALLPKAPPRRWLGMNDQAPLKERWVRASGGNWISLYPSWDTQLLICLSQSDYQRLFHVLPNNPPPLRIAVSGHSEGYYPIQIAGDRSISIFAGLSGYTEFERKWFSSFRYPPFFLIRQGNVWGPQFPIWNNLSALMDTP
ncbi:MAG: hypothetical protein ACAI44_26225 [Candidatus Sericytochromatia bacterium]